MRFNNQVCITVWTLCVYYTVFSQKSDDDPYWEGNMKLNSLRYKSELCFGCTVKTIKDTLHHPCQFLKIPDNLTVTHLRWMEEK